MIKNLLVLATLSLATLSCNKKQAQRMTVVRDCTGVYMRLDDKDYKVCNVATTDNYPTGATVKVSFKTIANCDGDTNLTCELYHPSEGWIKIVHIEE
jgi:hypothetical protein